MQKNNKKIFVFINLLIGLFLLTTPLLVNAAGALNDPCTLNSDCQSGICSSNDKCTTGGAYPSACQGQGLTGQACCNKYPSDPICVNKPGVAGDKCLISPDCGQGLICNSSGRCATPSQTTAPNGGSNDCALTGLTGQSCCNNYPTVPVCIAFQANPSSSHPSSSGPCPSPLEKDASGICLPKSATCTGEGLACTSSLTDLIVKVIKLLLSITGVISVLFLIIGGFWYMTSAGNEEQAEKGKNTITNFFLGLVIIIMAYTLVTVVSNLLAQGK